MTFASKTIKFFETLESPSPLPKGVEVMNPYREKAVMKYVKAFYKKFYSDNNKRVYIIGINPGRFGAGVTGIPFTDPVTLRDECGIANDLGDKKEFSSEFIYSVTNAYGGVNEFYSRFYINSICPLGFTKDGRNYNYYDDPKLVKMLECYLVEKLWMQVDRGAERKHAVCLGTGKNYSYFKKLNDAHGFFDEIIAAEHPRFILQYKRRFIPDYVKKYTDLLLGLSV